MHEAYQARRRPTIDTKPQVPFHGWARDYATRGWKVGDLSREEVRLLCGAVLELLERVDVVVEDEAGQAL